MLVSMPMMNVRIVGMCVDNRLVPMRMRVGLRVGDRRIIRTVRVLVMHVMHVRMRVFHRNVGVLM